MKKIFSIVIIGLLFNIPFLLADGHKGKPNPEKMIEKFQDKGGSEDGAKILKQAFAKIDKKSMDKKRMSMENMRNMKEELKAIIIAPTFDEQAFRAKTKMLHEARSMGMMKMLDMQVMILSKLSQDDRKIYLKVFKKKMKPRDNR